MKLAVLGSRKFKDYALLETTLSDYNIDKIISGGALGADSLARTYAQKNNIELIELLPDYDTHNKIAPILRNIEIIKQSDYVIAFWDGSSKGTAHAIEVAKKEKKPIKIINFKTKRVVKYTQKINRQLKIMDYGQSM
ncbi:MAG: DUF2493 domain-containing protein [Firmicutes bacterium]|nr:DUF2493 domain-containing protein [Bacillota bacterium]